jgi:hypothetical protein
LRQGIEQADRVIQHEYQEKRRAFETDLQGRLEAELEGKSKADQKIIKKKYDEERKAFEENLENELTKELKGDQERRKIIKKLDEKEARERKKKQDKELKDQFNTASSALGSSLGDIFQGRKIAKALDALEEQGASKEDAQKAVKAAQADAVYKALAGFAKQLESTATEVAEAQSIIDTRLYGSSNTKTLGSY